MLAATLSALALGCVAPAHAQTVSASGDLSPPPIPEGQQTGWNTDNATIIVGNAENGTLTIESGGAVSSGGGVIGSGFGSAGVVTLCGTSCDPFGEWDETRRLSAWFSAGGILVGRAGSGYLSISNRGTVYSTVVGISPSTGSAGQIGGLYDSDGSVVVTDAGSEWVVNGGLIVGIEGSGDLTISSGGRVASNHASLGLSRGDEYAGIGTATVTDAGSEWAITQGLTVGERGIGTLSVNRGASLSSGGGIIGTYARSQGAVSINGAGAQWTSASSVIVGRQGSGRLTIANGGRLDSDGGSTIGQEQSAAGIVTVSGAGSQWNNTGALSVGVRGGSVGRLTIGNGGAVSNTAGHLANFQGAEGFVTVTGPGSEWTNSELLTIGSDGAGHLTVADGGRVSSLGGYLGFNQSARGTVRVGGAGSEWISSRQVTVGDRGEGLLAIGDGGTISAPGLRLGTFSGGRGTFAIGAAAGDPAAAPGIANVGLVEFVAGIGTIVFNHTATGYDFAPTISGRGMIEALSGTTTLSGNASGFLGTTTVAGGRLIVRGQLGGAVSVAPGATLGGSGTLGDVTVADGGIVAPGASIGTLTVTGDLVLNPAAQLHYEIGAPGTAGSPGASDLIVVGGHLTLDGRLHLLDDGGAGIGHYRLMTYGALTDNGLDVVTPGPIPNATYTVQTGGGNVDLVIAGGDPGPGPDPEIGDPNLQYWQDASPTWTGAGTDWRNAGGAVDVAWAGNHGVFNGPGGTISVEGTQSFGGLQFATGGYVLGGSGTLETLAGGSELRVLAGETATLGTVIAGGGGIAKTQGGTLILTGDNTHLGTIVSAGTLVLDGGSLDHAGGSLFVTHFDSPGTAALRIENGGTASSFDGWVGSGEGAQGTATVTGPGSNWTVDSGITVGDSGGAGTLILADGGTAASNVGTIGTSKSQGTATVTGPGSTWTMGSSIAVGLGGPGTLRIEDGGAVVSPTGFVGFAGGAQGAVTVTGPGSAWTLAEDLFVGGHDGNGVLTVDAGGLVAAGSAEIGSPGGTGRVHLGSHGTLQAPLVQVLENGTLSGIGNLVGDLLLAPGGTLAPGESIGTLEITGNATFNPGATYVVEVEAPDRADLLSVTGTVTINGGAVEIVKLSPEHSYADGQTYRLIQAGTVVRNGDLTLDQPFVFLTAELDYGTNFLDLLLSAAGPAGDFTTIAQTFNQRQAGTALNDLHQSGDALAVYNALLVSTDANEARRAFDLTSGEVHASGRHVIDQSFDLFNRTLRGQASAGLGGGDTGRQVSSAPLAYGLTSPTSPGVAAIAGATVPAHADGRVPQAWLAPLGGRGIVDTDGNAARLDWRTLGIAGGYEGPIAVARGEAYAGFGLGYLRSRGSLDAPLSTMEAGGFHIGTYGGWTDGPWSLAGALGLAANAISTERHIVFGGINETASADYWSRSIGFSGETAYGFDLGDGTTISPLFTLDAGWSGHGGFTETGAGALDLTGAPERWTRIDTGLGVALQHVVPTQSGKVTLDGRLLWEHAFADLVPDQDLALAGSPTGFTVNGPIASRDRVRLGLGLTFEATEDLTIRANYSGLFLGGQQSHTASIGLNIRF